MEFIQPYITGILQALLGILVTLIGAGLLSIKKKLDSWIENRTSVEQREILHKLAKEGFALAEATFKEAGGQAKLEAAQDYMIYHLRVAGIHVSALELRAIIEKVVLDYHSSDLSKEGKA